MRRILMTAVAAATLGISGPAMATVALTPTSPTGTPDSYQVFGIASTGNVVYGSSPNNTNTPNVTFDSGVGTTVQVQVKNGAAQIDPSSGTWTQLIINPNLLFTDMKFAVSLTGGTGTGTINVFYLLTGPTSPNGDNASLYTQSAGSFDGAGNNLNWEINGDTFNGIMLQLSAGAVTNGWTFGTVKQISYEPFVGPGGVPEPSTWAMMLLGFGGMGMALRRSRRRSTQTLMQIA